MSTAQELRGKSEDELKTMLVDLKKEAFNLRFQKAGGQLENTTRLRHVKRETARVLTLLTEHSLPADKKPKISQKPAKKKAAVKKEEKAAPAKKPAAKKTTTKKEKKA